MSKNKDIEALHRFTGEPYRVCRAKMKANGWDLWTVKSIDWEELRRAAEELKKMQDERLIQCTAEHCPTDPEEGCENCAGYEPMGGWL